MAKTYNVTKKQWGKLRATLTEYQDNSLKLKITNGERGATWSGIAASNVWDTIADYADALFWLDDSTKWASKLRGIHS